MKTNFKYFIGTFLFKLFFFMICLIGIVSFSSINKKREKLNSDNAEYILINEEISLTDTNILVCPIKEFKMGFRGPIRMSSDDAPDIYIYVVDFFEDSKIEKENTKFLELVEGFELEEFPVVIRSFEKNQYDSKMLRDFLPKCGMINNGGYEVSNCGSEISSIEISPIIQGVAKFNYYERDRLKSEFGYIKDFNNKNNLRPQLDFFHRLMSSEMARGLLYDYLFNIFKEQQKNLPNQFKLRLIQQLNQVERFLRNIQSLDLDELKDSEEFWEKYGEGNLDAFFFRRMVTDKIPNEELLNQVIRFRKEINAKEITNIYKLTINNELILKDKDGCGVSVESIISKKEIVIPNLDGFLGPQNLRVRKMSENGINYYQFEIQIKQTEQKFMGLYDSELNLIRGIDD